MAEISIVIPTFRRHDVLARTLARLEAQSARAASFEVIVVDDPSGDDPERVRHAIGERAFDVRQESRPAAGVSAARNAGWRAARAPVVLYLGDDILAAPDLVARHLAAHARNPDRAVGILGHVEWARELRVSAFMRWLDHGIQFDYPSIEGDEAGWGRFYTANVSLRRELLEESGGFDESFDFGYEDLDLAKRLHDEHGFRLLYEPDARAEHLHPPTLEEWRRRMAQIARSERRFVDKHPDVEPFFERMLRAETGRPRARGRGARLASVVPRSVPWLGPRVWWSADAYFRQQLAPAFLAAWDEGQSGPETGTPSGASSGGP